MNYGVQNTAEYLKAIPEEKQVVIKQLMAAIEKNLPKGFEPHFNYGMLGWVVPFSLYPKGYHCDTAQPLPFLGVAAQKNHYAVYHMGIYADPVLLKWFQDEFAQLKIGKLDMGKSCIRFKNPAKIPYELIGKLAKKMTPKQWIDLYESHFNKK